MSLARASISTAVATACKVGTGFVVIKLLAVHFGPEGVGRAGNYMTLVTLLGVLSGGGIFNGVTKYVAEYEHDPVRLRALLGTAAALVLGASTLLGVALLALERPIWRWLFPFDQSQGLLRIAALLQFVIAGTNLLLAILRGYRDVRGHALSLIAGSLFGLVAYVACVQAGGYPGALVGLTLLPAAALLPAAIRLRLASALATPGLLRPQIDRAIASKLLVYTLMTAATAVTLPPAYVLLRNQLAATHSLREVGLWQGVSKISDGYLQFITAAFAVYLLPTFSRITDKRELAKEVYRALRFVLPAVTAASLCVYLGRHLAIRLLFSAQFAGMSNLFAWQLGGDVFKAGAYVFGYVIVARAALRWYVLAELCQLGLLLSSSWQLISSRGALGAAQPTCSPTSCILRSAWACSKHIGGAHERPDSRPRLRHPAPQRDRASLLRGHPFAPDSGGRSATFSRGGPSCGLRH